MQLSVILPKQRYSYKEKSKDDFKWAKDCIDAIAIRMYQYNANDNTGYSSDIARKLTNYRLYNNQIDQEDFERECNPYNIKAEEFIDKIQPYNKIPNKVNVLLGEELKRPFNFKVFLVNDSAVNAYERAKKELQKKYIQATLNQEIAKYKVEIAQMLGDPQSEEEAQQMQQQIEQEINDIIPPEQIEKYLSTNWRDSVEIMMDQLLQWFNRKLRIKSLKNDGFKHALISGEEHAWVGVINNTPVVKLLNPVKTFYHKASEVPFVQDGVLAGYRTRSTPGDILDEYGEDLTDEQKEKIDSYTAMSNLYGMTDQILSKEINLLDLNKSLEWRLGKGAGQMITVGSYGPSMLNDLDVVHVEWRSQRKFVEITYIDEDGEKQSDLLDETFDIPDNATKVKYINKYGKSKTKYVYVDQDQTYEFEYLWLPEVWEGTRIAYDIYTNIRPKPYQQRSLKDPFKVKLGYHGLAYNSMNATNISLVDRGKPFQYLYFILLHKMKEVIAKDMPPLTMIDMSMIPKTLTNEQWLYYYKQGLGFYDPNQNNEGSPQVLSGQKGPAFEVPRSAMQHVNNYIEILQWVDNQINEVMGITKQREGQTAQYETATNAQQNIVQSSNITEILFQAHNSLWEQILTSLIETAQICYKDNPEKLPIILDDLSRTVLDMGMEGVTDAELGAFISDSVDDAQNLEKIRQMALTFAQNGSSVPEIINLFQTTSMAALKQDAEAYDRLKKQMEQAQEQAQQQHEKELQQMQIEAREDEQEHEILLKEMDIEGKKEIAAMQVYNRQQELDANGNNIPDPLEAAELQHKINMEERKINNDVRSQSFEEIKHAEDLREREKDRQLEKEKIKSQEKIAKSRPKPKK